MGHLNPWFPVPQYLNKVFMSNLQVNATEDARNATVRTKGNVVIASVVGSMLDEIHLSKAVVLQSDGTGTHLREVSSPLYAPFPSGQSAADKLKVLFATRGFATPIVRKLKSAGHLVTELGTVEQLGAPNIENVPTPENDVDVPMLKLVQHHAMRIIRVGPSVDRVRLIVEMATAFPALSFIVIAVRLADVWKIARILRGHGVNVTPVTCEREPAHCGRVVVTTPRAVGYGAVRLRDRDVHVAYDAAETVTDTVGYQGILKASRARTYGFVDRSRRLSQLEKDLVSAVYGFHVCDVPRHGRQRLPVDVVVLKVVGGQQLPQDVNGICLHRQGIWRHELRNRRITALAKALVAGDRQTIKKRFPSVARTVAKGTLRAAVLVANVDQGLAIAKVLPNWALKTAADVRTDGLSAEDRRFFKRNSSRIGDNRPQIITAAAAHQIDPTVLDVLIRADGGSGLPPAPDVNCDVNITFQGRLLLVDFDDRHHPALRKMGRERRQAYRSNGWYSPGADPAEERVKDFLAARERALG